MEMRGQYQALATFSPQNVPEPIEWESGWATEPMLTFLLLCKKKHETEIKYRRIKPWFDTDNKVHAALPVVCIRLNQCMLQLILLVPAGDNNRKSTPPSVRHTNTAVQLIFLRGKFQVSLFVHEVIPQSHLDA